MICRIWKAWCTKENAPKYSKLFQSTIIPQMAKGVVGYKGANVLSLEHENEVEVTTLIWFDSMDDIISFAGENYETAVAPPAEAHDLILRHDDTVQHHKVLS